MSKSDAKAMTNNILYVQQILYNNKWRTARLLDNAWLNNCCNYIINVTLWNIRKDNAEKCIVYILSMSMWSKDLWVEKKVAIVS